METLIIIGIVAAILAAVLIHNGVTVAAMRKRLDDVLGRLHPTTATPAPPTPAAPYVPPVAAPTPVQPAPVAVPTELAPAYIDDADFYKALGAAVAAGYSGGVYLNGKMEHNGFGPFDYYEKTANGNVVRTTRPTTVPAPVPAPVATDVAIGTE